MRRIVALVRCSHPEPVVVVTALAGALALTAGRGPGTVWVALAILAGQLFVGWSNDYLDRNRDREAGRRDKPIAGDQIAARTVGVASLVALAAAVPLSLMSGIAAAAVHFVGLASAASYNLGLKRTPLSPLPYAFSFALFPAFVTLGLSPPRWPPVWVFVAALLIGVGGHFAQARPDVARDRAQGALGVPQLTGERGSAVLAACLLGAGAVVIAAGAHSLLPLIAIVPLPAVVFARPDAAYRLTLLIAALTVGAFLVNGGSVAA
jgi:4-hydroxybenzoate polyprenyltransferase